MPIQIVCPHCDAELRVPESIVQTGGKCPKCGGMLVPAKQEIESPSRIPSGLRILILFFAFVVAGGLGVSLGLIAIEFYFAVQAR